MNYSAYYRLGVAPWEKYAEAAADGVGEMLDREERGRGRPLGRALDGLDAEQRRRYGRSVAALAGPGASLLMLEFGPTRLRPMIGGVSEAEVREALAGWELQSTAPAPAPTKGLG